MSLMGALGGAAVATAGIAAFTWIVNGNQRYMFSSPISRGLIIAGAIAGFFLIGPPR